MSLSVPSYLEKKLQKPVAILGRGESGQAVAHLIHKLGGDYRFYTEASYGEGTPFDSSAAMGHDLVIFSPGFSVEHPWIQIARETGCLTLGELEFARKFWKGRLWCVTGTNGKTTTVSLLVHLLKHSGLRAVAVGNIGYAFSRAVITDQNQESTVGVCEVSSFQAESFQGWSSDAGIWSSFSPNHLDRHQSLEHYFKTKCGVFRGVRKERLFLGKSVLLSAREMKRKEWLPENTPPLTLNLKDSRIPPFFKTPAQIENLQLCWSLFFAEGDFLGIEPSLRMEQFYAALPDFQPPLHRVQYVTTLRGIDFWDDSKATNSAAVSAALEQFSGRRVHWIGGGLGKGESLGQFAALITPRFFQAYTIGTTGRDLAQNIRKAKGQAIECNSLEVALNRAFQEAQKGDVILLSPGFASFDQFKSYVDRGESFQKMVFQLSYSPENVNKKTSSEKSHLTEKFSFKNKPEL